ncbi:unnamed protein product [marine sediment metagenome]|uniref:Uncharacterized protein n=1 Tax=marine sediment metagenome TaxID=412755 RepID=X1E4N2_9ZZZZ
MGEELKMRKKLSTRIKEGEDKINRNLAGKKANITRDYNEKLKKLLNNQLT